MNQIRQAGTTTSGVVFRRHAEPWKCSEVNYRREFSESASTLVMKKEYRVRSERANFDSSNIGFAKQPTSQYTVRTHSSTEGDYVGGLL